MSRYELCDDFEAGLLARRRHCIIATTSSTRLRECGWRFACSMMRVLVHADRPATAPPQWPHHKHAAFGALLRTSKAVQFHGIMIVDTIRIDG
jgi:hypothetical protein